MKFQSKSAKKLSLWPVGVSLGMALGVLTTGCGSSSSYVPPVAAVPGNQWNTNCPAGQTGFYGSFCFPTGNMAGFQQTCVMSGGSVTQISGATVCRYSTRSRLKESYWGSVPELDASGYSRTLNSATTYAFRSGDLLTIEAVSGKYGTDHIGCSDNLVQASDSGHGLFGAVVAYGGQRQSFFAGQASSVRVNQDGVLHLGFNTDHAAHCGNIDLSLNVLRCMDAQGKSYPCN